MTCRKLPSVFLRGSSLPTAARHTQRLELTIMAEEAGVESQTSIHSDTVVTKH